jgi:hypothetical protein
MDCGRCCSTGMTSPHAKECQLPHRHTYEAWAIASWLESHDTSPMTNEEMSSKEVAPNKSLKAIIDLLYPMAPIKVF